MNDHITVTAPGSIGNVGPGLDVLGLALTGGGDTVTVAWNSGRDTVVDDPGHPDLPRDPTRNTAAIAAREVLRRAGIDRGIRLRITKGLPLSGGQGGSAASAIAGAVAAHLLGEAALDTAALLSCALEAESTVAGRHLDNLAPSLLGGLVLVRTVEPVDVIALPVPAELRVVLVHPAQQLRTRDARSALPTSVSRDIALQQGANIAAIVAGACLGDLALLGRAIDDRIAEPARTSLLPGFPEAKRAALDAGALGCSISGAGPTAFAIVDADTTAERVADAMRAAYQRAGVAATTRHCTVDRTGARRIA